MRHRHTRVRMYTTINFSIGTVFKAPLWRRCKMLHGQCVECTSNKVTTNILVRLQWPPSSLLRTRLRSWWTIWRPQSARISICKVKAATSFLGVHISQSNLTGWLNTVTSPLAFDSSFDSQLDIRMYFLAPRFGKFTSRTRIFGTQISKGKPVSEETLSVWPALGPSI